MNDPKAKPASSDEVFQKAVVDWRTRHGLREDDAVLLMIDLFRVHQQHWDSIRRGDMPNLDLLRVELAALLESNRRLQSQSEGLAVILKATQTDESVPIVPRSSAWLAALAGGLAGYILGRAWL